MRLSNDAQIHVLQGRNIRNPLALYITEILEIEGFCYQLVEGPSDDCDILIVPNLDLAEGQQQAIRDFATRGGNLIALRPPLEMADLFGLKEHEGQIFGGNLKRRKWPALQVHDGNDLYTLDGAEMVAGIVPNLETTLPGAEHMLVSHPAIARCEADGGKRAIFCYDLARCVVLLHQGRPDQASDGVLSNANGDVKFTADDQFLGFLDPRLHKIPQADMHQKLLVELLYWMMDDAAPIPRLWRYPDLQPCVAFINGDGDGAPLSEFDLGYDTCEEFGIAYSTYIMEDQYDRVAPDNVNDWIARGHSAGLHPWLKLYPEVDEFKGYLRGAFAGFEDRYGFMPTTSRNHSVIWAGWVETARMQSEIGVRMDLNVMGGRYFGYGILGGSLLPHKFMDASGQIVDIFEQLTICGDDQMLFPKCHLPAHTVAEATEVTLELMALCEEHHGVFQPYFHPIRLRSSGPQCLPWLREVLAALKAKGIPGYSGDFWANFNDARRQVQVKRSAEGWEVSSPVAINGLGLLLPARFGAVKISGSPATTQRVDWTGPDCLAISVDLQPDEAVVVS